MAFRINKDLLDREVKKIKQVIKNNPNNPLKNMSDYLIRKHVEKDLINDQRLKNGIDKKYGVGLDKRLSDIHMREMKETDPERYEKHMSTLDGIKKNADETHYRIYGEHLYEEFE